jgi:mannose-6-phosphate isomerase
MFPLRCRAQNYAWGKQGSESAVAQMLEGSGEAIDGEKRYAELWCGTHRSGPSELVDEDGKVSLLSDWLVSNPAALGERQIGRYGTNLPWLFKTLSINSALSIQVHPNIEQAQEMHRLRPTTYDDNHKPEMAVALTPFEALCSFRPLSSIARDWQRLPALALLIPAAVKEELAQLETASSPLCKADESRLLQIAFTAVLQATPQLLTEAVTLHLKELEAAKSQQDVLADEARSKLFVELHGIYGVDAGLFCLFFLHYVNLQAGDAIFLNAGVPHAYLRGNCVEIMAASDNVVRCGLTPKEKDIASLLLTLQFETVPETPLVQTRHLTQLPSFVRLYEVPIPEFALISIDIPVGAPLPMEVDGTEVEENMQWGGNSPAIWQVHEGEGIFSFEKTGQTVAIHKGTVSFQSATSGKWTLRVTTLPFRAYAGITGRQ